MEPDVSIGFDPGVASLRRYPWLFDAEGPVELVYDVVWTRCQNATRASAVLGLGPTGEVES